MANSGLLLYLPVYHQGCAHLFARWREIENLYLLEREDLAEFGPVHKDLHALPTKVCLKILVGLARFEKVSLARESLATLIKTQLLVIPNDELVSAWVAKNLPHVKNIHIDNTFLRWTKNNALSKKNLHATQVSVLPKNIRQALTQALSEGKKSSDWWRQVGCALQLASGEVLTAYNQHLPLNETPNIVGDVRSQFHAGEHFELTSAIHAEAAVIAQAAKQGLPTQGATLVVTDFPCPVCAKLIAAAGIKTVYFCRGYSLLDGEEILRSFGVQMIQVAHQND